LPTVANRCQPLISHHIEFQDIINAVVYKIIDFLTLFSKTALQSCLPNSK